jgi:hypothetical protein
MNNNATDSAALVAFFSSRISAPLSLGALEVVFSARLENSKSQNAWLVPKK